MKLAAAVITCLVSVSSALAMTPRDPGDLLSPAPEIVKDRLGRITTITSASGETTRYEYFEDDERALMKSATFPNGERQEYSRTAALYAHGVLLPFTQPLSLQPNNDDTQMCSTTGERVGFMGYFYSCATKTYLTPSGRIYDPEIARFLQQDSYLGTINNPPSLNRYAYGLGNPTRYVDPSGHENFKITGDSTRQYNDPLTGQRYNGMLTGRETVEVVATSNPADALAQETSYHMEDPINRISGFARVQAGAFQATVAAGLVETPAAPLAVPLAYRAGENIGTGARMMATGKAGESPSATLARLTALNAGASQRTASHVAAGWEIGADLAAGALVDAPLTSGLNPESPLGPMPPTELSTAPTALVIGEGNGAGRVSRTAVLTEPSQPTELRVLNPHFAPRIKTEAGNTLMLREAVGHMREAKGSPQQIANLFDKLGAQITAKGDDWSIKIQERGTDGSYIFIGNRGETLVVGPDGGIFKGASDTAVKPAGGHAVVPVYENMRKLN